MMESYVGLNVGGKVYKTSQTTLTRDPNSFFALLLDGRVPSAKDDRGRYIIDRDGELFRHVLNYLRLQKLVLPDGYNEQELLLHEADFFQLDSMKRELQALIRDVDNVHSPSEVIRLSVGGKLFQTTRETLRREPQSFFTAMLNGETLTQREATGTYLIDRDGEKFRDVLEYLRLGWILLDDVKHSLEVLRIEANFFNLKILKEHIKSLHRLQSNPLRTVQPSMDLYYFLESRFCVVYTNTKDLVGKTCFLPLTPDSFYTTCGRVFTVSFFLERSKGGTSTGESHTIPGYGKSVVSYPSNEVELMMYIGHRTQIWNYSKIQLNADCYKFIL
ncbi:BTB/POZ domain-containing protein KCTD4-like [Lytechinus variegatus]|uniref:BTB/POZ domain-containing protein KCTD4-like n=1 Tax=Lytechinus variegatus TaxID=7654 RepID=UPI001BB1F050|nr:BTB/POZ domain-containing protein KCTD4-like [Lytechinus variegatus]